MVDRAIDRSPFRVGRSEQLILASLPD